MRITVDESAYSKKFHSVLYSWDRYVIAYGGRGSTKTDTFYLKYLLALFEPFYFKLAYVNKEFSGIREGQYAGFKRVAKRVGLFEHLKFFDGDYRILNPRNGNSLIPKGMDDPEKTKGFDSVTAIWWDEINKGDPADFEALDELLRTPEATYLQFAISFNPVRETHWLRNYFFHPDDAYALHPDFKHSTLLHHSTYLDNDFIDQDAYLETLSKKAEGNNNKILVNVLGKWGDADPVVNRFMHAYDDVKHVSPTAVYNPNLPLVLSMDFNVNPLCGIWAQWYGRKARIIGEVEIADGNIGELCKQIERKLQALSVPKSRLLITGDKNGSARKIGMWDNKSSYIQIKDSLRLADSQFKLPPNPLISNSRVHCNQVFDEWDILIHSDCTRLRSDLMTVGCNADGDIIKKNRKSDSERADHLDALRYFVNTFLK